MTRRRAPKTLRVTDRGLIHAYIGDGKGKTTAAVGTAVRARGYRWRVAFVQFMKEEAWPSGERAMLRILGIDVHVLGQGFYKILNDRKPAIVHVAAAKRALRLAQKLVSSGDFQLVVLDELGTAVDAKILTARAVADCFDACQRHRRGREVHIIWTGHERIPTLLKRSDLVTDMRMVKHPYYRGILATKGLDF